MPRRMQAGASGWERSAWQYLRGTVVYEHGYGNVLHVCHSSVQCECFSVVFLFIVQAGEQ